MPKGALRSGTSCVIDAAGPERWFIGVTVSRSCVTPARLTEADHEVTPTLLPARATPVCAFVSATAYVVAPVAAFQVASTVKFSAGLVNVIARPVTGPGLGGGLASADATPRPTASAAAVRAMAVMRAARDAANVWSRESSSRGRHGRGAPVAVRSDWRMPPV